jgi:RNA polymerase sigma-70 factor (ECF subfamily)
MSIDATERVLELPLLGARRTVAQERAVYPAASTSTDEELLGRIGKQDEEALLTLFGRYSRLVYSIGCRILRDEGEAEDLVQEIFLNLHGEEASFDSEKGSARTWMVQMIYRRAFDRRAYLKRRHFYSGTDVQEHANAITGERTFEQDVIERLTVQTLRAAFDELSVRQRETLELFFFDGLKLTEIAERLGVDVPNVRHHYYRGLEKLRQGAREMMRNGKSE